MSATRSPRRRGVGGSGAVLLVVILFGAACGDGADLDAGDGSGDPTTTTSRAPGPDPGAPWAELGFAVRLLGPGGATSSYDLTCTDDVATVAGDPAPAPADAMCLTLENPAVGRRLAVGPPPDQMCTEIYGGPETARVTGTLDGAPVDTGFHRSDGCGIADWDLFATLLPAPG